VADNQLLAPLPFLTLKTGCTVTVEAIDPSSGAAVSGVVVSEVAIYGTVAGPGKTLEESIDEIYVHRQGD